MKNHRFTFVELVLVCGCAVIIGALTIAAAAGSMAKHPKTIACADIMRGIDQKISAWENDNNGHLLPQQIVSSLWGRILADGGYFDNTGFFNKAIKVYPRKFACPAETRQRSNGKVKISQPSVNIRNSYDYGLNHFVHQPVKTVSGKLRKRAVLSKPDRIMRMTEGTSFRIDNKPVSATERHGKGAANVLYGDGHITFVSKVPYKGTPSYHGAFWFSN